MYRKAFALLATATIAGCADYTGPSRTGDVYALARVGTAHLPISLNPGGGPPLLVADTFRLARDKSQPDPLVLHQVTVIQPGPGGATSRTELAFVYRIDQGLLTYDNCPMGYFCVAASLVAAPRTYQIVGDSLFEVTPVGANLPAHVYGRVRF